MWLMICAGLCTNCSADRVAPPGYCDQPSSYLEEMSRKHDDPIFGMQQLYSRLGMPYNPLAQVASIPANISLLSSTDYLFICEKVILGTLPSQLGRLTRMKRLIFHDRAFISRIPSELGQLTELTQFLVFNGGNVTQVPSELEKSKRLLDLRLHQFRNLEYLPTELYNLTKLTLLDIQKSVLRTIPTQVGQLTELLTLRLWSLDDFRGVATELGDLESLTSLQMNEVRLRTLPTEVGRLTKLELLALWDNPPLEAIPSQVGSLTRLTFLSTSGGRVPEIPDVFHNMSMLQVVFLSYMKHLRHVPASLFRRKPYLDTLNFRGSFIEDLPDGLENVVNSLTSLRFGHRWPKIGRVEIGKIWQFTNLTDLLIEGIHYERLADGTTRDLLVVDSALGRLTRLTGLGLEGAPFTALPESIGRLTALKKLSIFGNEMRTFPRLLKSLPYLKRVQGIPEGLECTCKLLEWLNEDLFEVMDTSVAKCRPVPDAEGQYDGESVGSAYLELDMNTHVLGAPCLTVENVNFSIGSNETSVTVEWHYPEEFYFDPLIFQQWDGPGCYNCSGYPEFYGGSKNQGFSDVKINNNTLGFVLETSFASSDNSRPQLWVDRVCCYGSTRSFTFESLYPFTDYNIRIKSANIRYPNYFMVIDLGRSVWDLTARFGPWRQYEVRTGEAKPWDPPQRLRATEVRETSFVVTWLPPTQPNGNIVSYDVRINGVNAPTVEGSKQFLQVQGVLPGEIVNVSIRAATSVGPGPWTSFRVKTLQTCLAGEYRLSKGSTYICEPCLVNTYRDVAMGSACEECPAGRPKTNSTGTSSIDECLAVAGSFYDSDADETFLCDTLCMDCPEGTVTQTIIVRSGCWRWGYETSIVESCPRQEYCVPSTSPRNSTKGTDLFTHTKYCKDGHTGLYCEACLPGYGMGPDGCEKCGPAAIALHQDQFDLFFTGMCLTVLAVLFCLQLCIHVPCAKKKRKKSKSQLNGRAIDTKYLFAEAVTVFYKVCIGFFQVANAFVSVLSSNRVARDVFQAYGYDFEAIFQVLSIVNFVPSFEFATGCAFRFSHYERLLLYCLVPICFLVLMWLCYAIVRFFPGTSKDRLQRSWFVTLNATVFVILLLYPALNLTILRSFPCREVGGGRWSVLQADYSIDCNAEEYMRLRRAASVFIAFWTVLPPILVGTVLYVYKSDTEALFSAAYRPGCMLYEVVDMVRKLVQVCVVVAFEVPLDALLFSFLTCIIFIVLFAIIRPFFKHHDNYLAMCAQVALLVIVFTEVVYLANFDGVTWEQVRGTVIATIVVVPLCCVVFYCSLVCKSLSRQEQSIPPQAVNMLKTSTGGQPGSKIARIEVQSLDQAQGDNSDVDFEAKCHELRVTET